MPGWRRTADDDVTLDSSGVISAVLSPFSFRQRRGRYGVSSTFSLTASHDLLRLARYHAPKLNKYRRCVLPISSRNLADVDLTISFLLRMIWRVKPVTCRAESHRGGK